MTEQPSTIEQQYNKLSLKLRQLQREDPKIWERVQQLARDLLRRYQATVCSDAAAFHALIGGSLEISHSTFDLPGNEVGAFISELERERGGPIVYEDYVARARDILTPEVIARIPSGIRREILLGATHKSLSIARSAVNRLGMIHPQAGDIIARLFSDLEYETIQQLLSVGTPG